MNRVLKKITAIFLAVLLGTANLAGAIPASAADGVEINEANFPDLVFRTAIEERVDEDHNGILSSEELAGDIYLSGWVQRDSTITTLKGIEYFTSTKLRVTDLIIPDMDVSGMKNLQTLTAMNLRGNESLDLSKNTSLKTVNVQGSTELKSLTLPASVTKLKCDECSFESLDLRALSELKFLSCEGNQLTSLDLSGNAELTFINCSYNHLKELDLSACTKLGGAASDYYIGSQQITATASFDADKNISVPSYFDHMGRITGSNVTEDEPYGGFNGTAFVFQDYSILENGIDYTYSVNLDGAEDMSVNIAVQKNFFKVSYLTAENGEEFNYQLINAGQSAKAPALPEMPAGMACGYYNQKAENVTQDMTVYVIWAENHDEEITAFENNIAEITCNHCGNSRTAAFADYLNETSQSNHFEAVLDVNGDGIINARDLAELSKIFKS